MAAITTFPTTILPTQSSSLATAPNIIETRYGDGYSERAANGINTFLEKWRLNFTLSTVDYTTVNNFLIARGGYDSFNWTNPITGIAGIYVCKKWNTSLLSGGWYSLTTTFEEVTDI